MTTMYAGVLPLRSIIQSGGWHMFVCPAGWICPNATARLPCPIGHYCELGANESKPCTSGWYFSSDASEVCPEGTVEDLGSAYDQLFAILVAAVPLILLLEITSCLLKRRARVRRLPSASQDSIDGAKRGYIKFIRRRYDGATGSRQRFSITKALRRFCSSSVSENGSLASSSVTKKISSTTQRRMKNVTEVLGDATQDQINYFNALTPEEALAMPRDEDVRWVLAALCARSDSFQPSRMASFTRSKEGWIEHAASSPAGAVVANDQASQLDRESSQHSLAASGLSDLLPIKAVRGQAFIQISLRGLDFHIGSARVLKDLYCDAAQGQLVSLMGESGSGKSTLLNVLGGRSSYGEISQAKQMGGTTPLHSPHPMLLNEAPFEPRSVKALIGFVPQAHIIYKELTVFENLLYASQMRAEKSMTHVNRMRLVEMSLDLLGLQECRHFVCDPSLGERLSGGQMRRIGIGIELVCDPPIMLLDEPTSALDAVNTRLVITALKDLTRRGILVIASLHQPRESVFQMFDKLWLMRKGELAYGGFVNTSISHFATLGYPLHVGNPADFFIEVCFGMVPGEDKSTRVENIGRAWTVKAKREQAKEQRRRNWALEDPLKAERRRNARLLIRTVLIKELKSRNPDARLSKKAARISDIALMEKARVEREQALKRVDKGTWVRENWFPRFGDTMSDRVRDQLWHRATERAGRLRGSRQATKGFLGRMRIAMNDVLAGSSTKNANENTYTSERFNQESARSVDERMDEESGGSRMRMRHITEDLEKEHASIELTEPSPTPPSPVLTVPPMNDEGWEREAEMARQQAAEGRANRARAFMGGKLSSSMNSLRQSASRYSSNATLIGGLGGMSFSRSNRRTDGPELDHLPTAADLMYEMQHWQIDVRVVPGWWRHFTVCLKRGLKKLIRKRKHMYAKSLSVMVASAICGGVCYLLKSDRNLLAIIYMLCNALFATVIATGSIDVLGNREERELLSHEASSGVHPMAEALARIILDMLVLAPLGPIYAVPLQALSGMPIGTLPLISLYAQVAWAVSTFGYVFSLMAPNNSTLLTAACTLILYAFFSGPLIGPAKLPEVVRSIYWINPGFTSFIQIGMGNAVNMPFSLTRWALIDLFMRTEIIPSLPEESESWEYDRRVWLLPATVSLVGCGAVLRLLAIVIFAAREMHFDRLKRWRKRFSACLSCSRRKHAPSELDITFLTLSESDGLSSTPSAVMQQVSHLDGPPDLTTQPSDESSTHSAMMRQRAGAKIWTLNPKAPLPRTNAMRPSDYTVELPPAFVPRQSSGSLGVAKVRTITISLPSSARLTFTPHTMMKGGDLVQFKVPTSHLHPSDRAERRANNEDLVFPASSFTPRSARAASEADITGAVMLGASDAAAVISPEVSTSLNSARTPPSVAGPSSYGTSDMSGSDGTALADPAATTWECSRCSYINNGLLWECEMCCLERPGKLEHIKSKCVVLKTTAAGAPPTPVRRRLAQDQDGSVPRRSIQSGESDSFESGSGSARFRQVSL